MPRREVDRPAYYRFITHRLEDRVFEARCVEFARLLAESDLNLSKLALRVEQPARAVRRWVKCARDRGRDVVAMARSLLRRRGVDPRHLRAERVRSGMRPGRKIETGKAAKARKNVTERSVRDRPPSNFSVAYGNEVT